ncbi:MAG: hypothetical protein HQL41_13865 [Alphaproteobacteria bacterium]|nr:hypothetical protein [Alphaproteobacteria bacterium]
MYPIHKGEYGGYFLKVTSRFESRCKAAGARFHRFQDVYGRARAVIASDPGQRGQVAPRLDGVYVSDKDSTAQLPGMRIRYRYLGQNLLFMDIEVW